MVRVRKKRCRRMVILGVLIALWLVNVASFVMIVRVKEAKRAGTLICLREDAHSEVVNYLIAGLLNQPDVAFYDFLEDFEGSVVAVNFLRTGWEPQLMAELIQEDSRSRQAGEIRIWSLSVGDQAARFVESMMLGVKTVAVNPCTTPQCLQERFQGYGQLAKILQGICEYGLGWLSLLPVIPMSGVDSAAPTRNWKYSPMLLVDQLVAITCGGQPLGTYQADFVVLSEDDQFLDNGAVRDLFTVASRVYHKTAPAFCEIKADHCGTVVYAEAYREAFRESGLMKNP